ncbi:MAG: phosphate ABC transporter permease subunit PstC [Sorangiineae bacterium NIC37A_2]|jgi:phosphate transport system permease protein|nr:MAG: phosphate ABC transporter permease subunit PstC [Sorangiineae bacterium NIC37A_2]
MRQSIWPTPERPPLVPGRFRGDTHRGDRVFSWITAASASIVILTVLAMTGQMLASSWLSLETFHWSFITSLEWNPVTEQFGALPFIFGTIVSSTVALALAVPVSFGVALFLSELAPEWLRNPFGFLVELLAAVPSVVYGLWGIFALAPLMRETVEPALRASLGFLPLFSGPNQGYGMLTASVVLAIMITPTIASVSREVLRAVPRAYREAALGLGATQWEAIRTGVFPVARSGLVGAVVLGLGRALGETMAVTMLIGNRADISASLFAPGYTMASVIANEFTEATEDLYLSALAEIGLLLFIITVLLNIFARFLVWRVGRQGGA